MSIWSAIQNIVPFPDHIRGVDAIRANREVIASEFEQAQRMTTQRIQSGTVTADDFRVLGDAYGAYVASRGNPPN